MLKKSQTWREVMAKETIEEFLARGGKVERSTDKDKTLNELLSNEGFINEQGAKAVADLISSSITESLQSQVDKTTKSK